MSDNSRQLAVLPRPRSAWQAIDAGMLLARTHYWKLLVLAVVFGLVVQAFERTTHTDVPITGFI